MPITTSKRPQQPGKTRTIHITITEAEIERVDRFVEQVREKNPRLKPSRSLVIAEAIAQLVDGRAPVWERY